MGTDKEITMTFQPTGISKNGFLTGIEKTYEVAVVRRDEDTGTELFHFFGNNEKDVCRIILFFNKYSDAHKFIVERGDEE